MTKNTGRFVNVTFPSTHDYGDPKKEYVYKDNLDEALKPFDVVLVPTRYGWSLGIVRSVTENDPGFDTKQVAEKLSSKVLDEELKADRAKMVRKELDKRLKEIDEVERYRMYAEKYPELKELTEQLEGLVKGN